MQSLPGEAGVQSPSWRQSVPWETTRPFRIEWLADVTAPHGAFRGLLNPLDENNSVDIGRDGQKIPSKLGLRFAV